MPQLSKNREIPLALTNLRLCYSLRKCGKNKVEDVFDKCEDPLLFTYDDQNILGYSDWTNKEPEFSSKCFRVNNPNKNTLCLLPLDGRIITGPHVIRGGVCDCLLLSEQEMAFVEFKTNVNSPDPLNTFDMADKAISQLWNTFNIFLKMRVNMRDLSIDFHVVFDKDYKITGVNSSFMDLGVKFLKERKYPLSFENEKSFI